MIASANADRPPAREAPLGSIAASPVPPGGIARFVTMRDGACIRVALWPRPGARTSVIVLPGATEFIESYYETIGDLLRRGAAVGILDWRGQGLSQRALADPRKHHIDDFATYLEDFREIAKGPFAALPQPWLMLGQSMGGHIGARLVGEGYAGAAGLVLLAPMLGINTAPWPLAVARALATLMCALGGEASYVFGGSASSTFAQPFAGNVLSRDPKRYEVARLFAEAMPALDMGSPTFGWLKAAFASIDALRRPQAAERIAMPALLFEARADKVVVNADIDAFARRLPNGRLASLEGANHAILLERDVVRDAFWREYDGFVRSLLGGQ